MITPLRLAEAAQAALATQQQKIMAHLVRTLYLAALPLPAAVVAENPLQMG